MIFQKQSTLNSLGEWCLIISPANFCEPLGNYQVMRINRGEYWLPWSDFFVKHRALRSLENTALGADSGHPSYLTYCLGKEENISETSRDKIDPYLSLTPVERKKPRQDFRKTLLPESMSLRNQNKRGTQEYSSKATFCKVVSNNVNDRNLLRFGSPAQCVFLY